MASIRMPRPYYLYEHELFNTGTARMTFQGDQGLKQLIQNEALSEAAKRKGDHLDRLKNTLKNKRLVIIIDAGVILSATTNISGRPLPRLIWTSLIRNGWDYLVDDGYIKALTQEIEQAYTALENTNTDNLLNAANILTGQLAELG